MSPDDRTRWFCEGVMMHFLNLGVPVDQAANELVEVESHLIASIEADGEYDPFDSMGDPKTVAASLVPAAQLRKLRRTNTTRDVAGGTLLGLTLASMVQLVSHLLGQTITSPPKVLLLFVVIILFAIGQAAFSSILMGVTDNSGSLLPRGIALTSSMFALVVLFLTGSLWLAGADFGGSAPFEPGWIFWLTGAVAPAVVGVWLAVRWQDNWRQSPVSIEGGVTGQILHDMHHCSWFEGWVRFGPNGEDLRDPNWSVIGTFRSAFSKPPDS